MKNILTTRQISNGMLNGSIEQKKEWLSKEFVMKCIDEMIEGYEPLHSNFSKSRIGLLNILKQKLGEMK